MNPIVSCVWVLFSVVLVLELKAVQELFVLYGQGQGGAIHKIMPAVITSVMVAAELFATHPCQWNWVL